MVNHGRNLLLNISGVLAPEPSYPGEQHVPLDFASRTVPGWLENCRRILFGSAPDRAMLNWRLQELLTCIHACDLDSYLTDLDPRLTYWPFNMDLLSQSLRGPVAVQTGGNVQSLDFVGDRNASAGSDRIYLQWRLTVLDADSVEIGSTDAGGSGQVEAVAYTTTDGLSSPVPLPGASLAVRFTQVVGTRWQLSWLMRPRRSLTDVAEDAESRLNGELAGRLFPDDADEPYATFGNLWNSHEQLPYRLAGLALAVIYRLDGR